MSGDPTNSESPGGTPAPRAARPRYSPAPLPPYSYVPGFTPHPVSNPRGHMHGLPHESAPPLDPAAWRRSEAYLLATDLFNHGFYWEAHEAWESLWHAAGRRGPTATWLKALIKLAAAGVKAREGNSSGVQRHARRAIELIGELRSSLPATARTYCGLSLERAAAAAASLAARAVEEFTQPRPDLLLPEWLELGAD